MIFWAMLCPLKKCLHLLLCHNFLLWDKIKNFSFFIENFHHIENSDFSITKEIFPLSLNFHWPKVSKYKMTTCKQFSSFIANDGTFSKFYKFETLLKMATKLPYRHDFQLKDAMNFYENEVFLFMEQKFWGHCKTFLTSNLPREFPKFDLNRALTESLKV